jgi:hypothetical protein
MLIDSFKTYPTVLSFRLKVVTDEICLIQRGKLFHAEGPADERPLSQLMSASGRRRTVDCWLNGN